MDIYSINSCKYLIYLANLNNPYQVREMTLLGHSEAFSDYQLRLERLTPIWLWWMLGWFISGFNIFGMGPMIISDAEYFDYFDETTSSKTTCKEKTSMIDQQKSPSRFFKIPPLFFRFVFLVLQTLAEFDKCMAKKYCIYTSM